MWIPSVFILLMLHQVRSLSDYTWKNLKVTWSPPNVINKNAFHDMPLTIKQAKKAGFVPADDGPCSANIHQDEPPLRDPFGVFKGSRYYDSKDAAVSLLFDVNGYVAGIQTNYLQSLLAEEGTENWFEQNDMFMKNKLNNTDVYTATVYLVDPDIICNEGRTEEQFNETPGGTEISIQTKKDPVKVPLLEKDTQIDSVWVPGKCYPEMGIHYWYKISEDMDCHDFKPVYFLYEDGQLIGFGFIIITNVKDRERLEHSNSESFPLAMVVVPKCLTQRSNEIGGITTLHVYLISQPRKIYC